MITNKGLEKFIELYEQKYTVKLTKQEAFNLFSKLINLVKIVYSNDKNND